MTNKEDFQQSNVTVTVPPFVFTAAIVAIGLIFAVLTGADAFYHHGSIQDFLANWFNHFLLVLALVFVYLLVKKLLSGVPLYWHSRVMEHHERTAAAKKNERLDIQNKHLRAQTGILEQVPVFLQRASDAGMHQIEITAKGDVKIIPVFAPAGTGTIVTEQQPPAIAAPHFPTFAELVQNGTLVKAIQERRLVIGCEKTGVLRYGSWMDLYSCAVAGVSGSGKTTTVLFLLYQSILHGAKIILIDPHMHEPEESLAARLSPLGSALGYRPVDDSLESMTRTVRNLRAEVNNRIEGGRKLPYLMFVIDEFNAVMRKLKAAGQDEELAELLLEIAQEGRKFGVFAMLIGQRWSHEEIGGANIRSSLASSLAHRFTDENQAKLLIGTRNGAKCLELSTGHYLFRDTSGSLNEMITPYTDEQDIYTVLSLIGKEPARSSMGTRTRDTRPPATGYDEREPEPDAETIDAEYRAVETTEPAAYLPGAFHRTEKEKRRADLWKVYQACQRLQTTNRRAIAEAVHMSVGKTQELILDLVSQGFLTE